MSRLRSGYRSNNAEELQVAGNKLALPFIVVTTLFITFVRSRADHESIGILADRTWAGVNQVKVERVLTITVDLHDPAEDPFRLLWLLIGDGPDALQHNLIIGRLWEELAHEAHSLRRFFIQDAGEENELHITGGCSHKPAASNARKAAFAPIIRTEAGLTT